MKSTCMRIIILVAYPTDYTANEDESAEKRDQCERAMWLVAHAVHPPTGADDQDRGERRQCVSGYSEKSEL